MDTIIKSMPARFAGVLAAATLGVAATGAHAQPIAAGHAALRVAGEVILGGASFYDTPGEETASGEQYDPKLFTAAAQLEIRDKFGGIRFGREYRPIFALAEYAGKRAILKFNDVGPLRPGRKFDLSRAAMEHFGGIARGVLAEFKVTLLPPNQEYTPGPLPDVEWIPIESNGAPLTPVRKETTVLVAAATAEPETTASIASCAVTPAVLTGPIDIDVILPELTIGDLALGGPEALPHEPGPHLFASLD